MSFFNVESAQLVGFGAPVSLDGVPVSPNIASFAPAFSELGLDAFERLGMQAGELTVTHLNSMRRSMNLTLVRWSNNGLNLWEITNSAIALLPGVATYVLPTALIEMLDTYVTTGAAPNATDIIITPMSRNTYAALPNKKEPGRPILYWFNRTITPSVTVWPVPDSTQTYTLNYFGWSQVPDADPANGNTGNMPYRFLEAFTAGTASHLAMKWKPERAMALKTYADEVFVEAADEDRELVTLSMTPDFGPYFR